MKIKLLNHLLMLAVVVFLSACASEPSAWTKSSSPWAQKRAVKAEAPAAETYKAHLERPAEAELLEPVINQPVANEVELSYQTEAVTSLATTPPEAVEPLEREPLSLSLMDQPATYYTMQLMASVDMDRVLRFAEKNQISTRYVVPTVRDGVTWYVLLLDVYKDYSSAVSAREAIALQLKSKPWIRKVGSVQKIMR